MSDICVRGYNSATHIHLPCANTRDCIPANPEHMPTCEAAKRWSHLSSIIDEILPLLRIDIGFLIGYNRSRALAPRQVILGKEDEPYAVQTDLGWSVVGSTTHYLETGEINSFCHRVTVKEIPPVTPLDAIHTLESDFRETSQSNKTVSQEDVTFLNKLKEGIKLKKGRYEMTLPCRKRPYMPDNRQAADSATLKGNSPEMRNTRKIM